MSTSANPSAARLDARKAAGPKRVLPVRRRSRRSVWLIAVLLAAAGLAAWYFTRPAARQAAAVTGIRTDVIRTATLQQTMRITGSTSAGNFANIAAPLLRGPGSRDLTLIDLATPGSWVKAGDVVAQVDATQLRDRIDDVDAQIQTAGSDIRKRMADQTMQLENLRQSIRVAQARLEKARLDFGASEIRTPVDQELLKLSVEEYEASYKSAETDYKLRLASNASDLRLLEIARERHVRNRNNYVHNLERFTIRSPMEGLVVMLSLVRSGDMAQVQVGDQMAPNQPFMRIVDPNSMRVDAMINQVESERLRVGQPVVATFDAFPGIRLKGRVDSIGAIATGGRWQNFFVRNVPVKVALLEQDRRVIPDLSAAADVIVREERNVLVAPLSAIYDEDGKTVAYVRNASAGFTPVEVRLGMRNHTHAAVLSGLNEGDEVALQPPTVTASRSK
jgi:HlyD family secretion protein